MVEDCSDPSEITSVDVNDVLCASIIFLNKKRKLQVEQLGLPLSKHVCCKQGINSEFGSPSIESPETEGVCAVLATGILDSEEKDSASDMNSGNGSNSFAEDDDSIMSVSDGSKRDSLYIKMCSVDSPCTLEDQCGDYDKGAMFSLDSRADKGKLPCTNYKDPHHNIESLASMDGEKFSEYVDYEASGCIDYEDESIEQYKKLKLLYSSTGISEDLALSTEGWNNQQEKLTIDKEFEDYFSNLML